MVDEVKNAPAGENPDGDLLTLQDTTRFLGVSKQTLYRMLDRGDVRSVKVGRQRRFKKEELVAYLERGPVAVATSTVSVDVADEHLAALRTELQQVGARMPADPIAADTPAEAKIWSLANTLICLAIAQRASDIHLEAERETLAVRFRIDGVLHDTWRLPKSLCAGIIARTKMMADLNVEETRVPQDGRIQYQNDGREYDLRLNVMPTIFGESAVLRILDQQSVLVGMDRLGFMPEMLAQLQGVLWHPSGLLLFTGPTGCGKTTVMYSCLQMIASRAKKTVSIEDPVEYILPNVMQVQVNRGAGFTFPVALRSFMRHDPDVLMVGEIRDSEMGNLCTQAALTGHLVLSTLHTHDASSALTQLQEIGVPPFLVSSAVVGVLNQRLIRCLCNDCKAPAEVPAAALQSIGVDPAHFADTTFYKAVGCPACNGRGYRRRIGIYELLIMNEALSAAIIRGAPASALHQIAVEHGMTTLLLDGLQKAAAGMTTIEEVVRVLA